VSSTDWRSEWLSHRLADTAARGLTRRRRLVSDYTREHSSVEACIDGQCVLSFCSNDYLGLARHPALVAAWQETARRYGVGSGASHLVTGHHTEHHLLEEALATFTQRERAVLFSTGYMANLAVSTVFASSSDVLYSDELNHASLIDGARLSSARIARYPHGDTVTLAHLLRRRTEKKALLLTDGLFSMDGTVAPLTSLASLCNAEKVWLAVDDAHGLGVLGAHGRGSIEHSGIRALDVPILIGTLGKAFGAFGAFVAGSHGLCELLIQHARTHIFTTALPSAVAAAAHAALRISIEEPWRRERLAAHVVRFRAGCSALSLPLMDSMTPIQPIILGSNQAALDASNHLLTQGILVSAIRPPTVPKNSARLRITFSAAHTADDVDRLLEALGTLPPVLRS